MVEASLTEENTPRTAAWYRRHVELHRAHSLAIRAATKAGRNLWGDGELARIEAEMEAQGFARTMGGAHGRDEAL